MGGMLLGHLFTAVVGISLGTMQGPLPVTGKAVVNLLILGVFQLGVPYILYALAAKDCPPLACSLLGAVEPLLNPIWVFLFNGERLGPFALMGAVVVIVSVSAWCVWKGRQETQMGQTSASV